MELLLLKRYFWFWKSQTVSFNKFVPLILPKMTLFTIYLFSLHDTGISEYNQVCNWSLEKKWQTNNFNC